MTGSIDSRKPYLGTLPPAIRDKEALKGDNKTLAGSQHETFLRGALFLYRIQALLGAFFYLSRLEGCLPASRPLKTAQNSQKIAKIGLCLLAEL